MKFSWQLTNSFLKIQEESLKDVLEALILSGIEVEQIENTEQDKIIDLSITSNRKEIESTLSLAREISTTTNNILRIQPIKPCINRKVISNTKNCLKYRRIHVINENSSTLTPKWISNSLQIRGKHSDNYLKNIQEYINLKWGITFTIITSNLKELSTFSGEIKNKNKLIYHIINQNINKNWNDNCKLIIFDFYKIITNDSYNNYDSNEFYENYYIDSINIIGETNQRAIGKYYESCEEMYFNNKEITLDKNTLNKWIGSYKSNKSKFLPTKNIKKTLDDLKFFSKYIKKKRLFIIRIPPYREHDIKNKIDIIEEIGKMNEFKNFYNQYKYKREKGKKSSKLITINKIRDILRTLGFNEVVNCSINYNALKIKRPLLIHNPISEEQNSLRNSILLNLLENYKNHIKYSNNNLLISEIGKIFQEENSGKGYSEKQFLGGLIYAPKYNKINWSSNSKEINLSQVKGVLEIFFKQLNANINLNPIKISDTSNSIVKILKSNNRIGIYDKKTNELIGIIGEIKTKTKELNQISNNMIYVFEIDLEGLIKTRDHKIHLEYNKKRYSNYPSIIRDISIPINNNKNIEDVKKQIQLPEKELIESIEIFNEYKKNNKNSNKRFVGIRIIYRSLNRTLDGKDINKIENSLLKIRNSMNSE
uniref:phenylalanine--tRNA ligase n=1 Tax=Melanothamnus harveyi TaxID=397005 RepID=A0A1Z1MHF9_MELHR|nr:Phenylalanine-tRNA ligase beta subunit [Melanothamnus harveyi]ARW65292.1 Phenylalanine-tRNA ligase beta subunit [Melanothamnus harveyi]